MTKRVGLILCGAGFKDGSEIHEATLALLALEEAGAVVQCLALAKPIPAPLNHRTMAPYVDAAPRLQIDEAARIARGNVKDLTTVKATDFDAVVVPGGFGAALNLCDFAAKGAGLTVDPDVAKFLTDAHGAGKPIGAICIAPVLLAKVFGAKRPRLTIGTDKATAEALAALGAEHVDCAASDCVVDERLKLVTTPAYMLGETIREIHQGIRRLSAEVLRLTSRT